MSDQTQNLEGGEPQVAPQDPEYELQEHILFKRKQEILNHTFRNLIQKNLAHFQLIMDGTNFAFTRLALQNKGIRQVTETICSYTHLRTIDFGFNQLKQVGFLQKLKYVTELNLERNLIQDVKFLQIPDNFPYLKKLNLQGNQIQSLLAVQLDNLIHLNLNQNKIKSLEDFEGHPKLQILQLRRNKILSLKGLSNIPCLSELYLAQNNITLFAGLKDTPRLTKLHLRKNKINSVEIFPDFPSLKYLNLRQNQIRIIDSLKGVGKTVQTLNISACPLSEQLGDNTKKEVWMRFRHYERINKSQIGSEQKQQFGKQYKDRLAEQQRQRLEKQAAEKQARETAERQAAEKEAQQ